jgi:hypothetical protein
MSSTNMSRWYLVLCKQKHLLEFDESEVAQTERSQVTLSIRDE